MSKNVFSLASLDIPVLIFADLSVTAVSNGLPLVNYKNIKIKHMKRLVCQRLHWTRKNLYLEIC